MYVCMYVMDVCMYVCMYEGDYTFIIHDYTYLHITVAIHNYTWLYIHYTQLYLIIHSLS